MTGRGTFAVLQRTLLLVVLGGSGAYLIIYLYRWEWNRALISGVVFVAAEVALATSMLINRLDRGSQPTAAFDLALARLRDGRVDRRAPFRWLTPRGDRFSVFVPVLLGAGVVLSAIAYIVERLAESTAHVTVDRGIARRLAALTPSRPVATRSTVLRWRRPSRRVGPTAGVVAAAVIVALAVQLIAEATQSRPDVSDRPVSTSIVLAVDQRTASRPLDTADALWVACRPTLSRRHPPDATVRARGSNVVLELRPGIRDLETRRLTGCLEDATLELVRADVVSVDHERADR